MKILYLSGSYVPSRRASSVHVMRMCQALAELGHEVVLVNKDTPEASEAGVKDVYQFYGVEPVFSIEKLKRPSFRGGGIWFMTAVWKYLRENRQAVDIVYSRDIPGAWIATRLGLPTIFEAHGVPPNGLVRSLYQGMISEQSFLRLIVISQGLKDDLANLQLLPIVAEVVVAHDGAIPIKDQAPGTDRLGQLKDDGFAVGYIGQLYPGKGIEVILPLARRMADVCFHIIGGQEEDLRYWQAQKPPQNVKFHGFISPGEISDLYRKFDVLVLPAQNKVYGASGQSEISRWMSPMKMFEYMATGKPIVSSDLPVLREVLADEQNALLVGPDDIDGWETAVRRLQLEPVLAARLGQQAQQDLLDEYTWAARAKKVLLGL